MDPRSIGESLKAKSEAFHANLCSSPEFIRVTAQLAHDEANGLGFWAAEPTDGGEGVAQNQAGVHGTTVGNANQIVSPTQPCITISVSIRHAGQTCNCQKKQEA